MSDIRFNCPSCKQSLDATPDMAGQLIDCPSCKNTIEVPMLRSASKVEIKPSPQREAPEPCVSLPPSPARNTELASATTSKALPKILSVLVIIAIMIGSFFAYNFWKDQQRAKAEAPFFLAAKEALDEAHKMQSAMRIGLNYQKYGDLLIALAPKVDNLLRAAVDTGIENLNPDAKVLCQHLFVARDEYKSACKWWEIKIQYPDSDNTEVEKELQDKWSAASKAIDEADKAYFKLKNQ